MKEITEEKARQVLLFLNGGEDFVFEQFLECIVFLRASDSKLCWLIDDKQRGPCFGLFIPSDVPEDKRCRMYLDKCFELVKSHDIVKGLWGEHVMKRGTCLEMS